MPLTSRKSVLTLPVLVLLCLFWVYVYAPNTSGSGPPIPESPLQMRPDYIDAFRSSAVKALGANYSRTLVIGRLKSEDVSWIHQELPDLDTAIYVVDDPSAQLTVPKNKGREAMVYLSYIIDHYESLPDTVLFFHAHRSAWHNNILLDLDSAKTIRRLSDERVARVGYMNTRCHLDPGCPNWIHLARPDVDYDPVKKPEEKAINLDIWRELHPGERVPPVLSQPCCAQFAVSGERIRANPKSQYKHYRNWLLNTKLDDATSGRVLEYSWQWIFTRNAEFCPIMHSCYCDGYGICFGNAENLQAWLDLLRMREVADERIAAGDYEQSQKAQIEWQKEELIKEIEKRKREAYARGDDPRNRELEREKYQI